MMGEVVKFDPRSGKIETATIVAICFLDHDMVPIKSDGERAWYGVAGLWIDKEKKDLEVRLFAAFMEKEHAYDFALGVTEESDKVQWMNDETVDSINDMLNENLPDLQELLKSFTQDDDPEVH